MSLAEEKVLGFVHEVLAHAPGQVTRVVVHQCLPVIRRVYQTMLRRAFADAGIRSEIGKSMIPSASRPFSPASPGPPVPLLTVVIAPDVAYGWLGNDVWRCPDPRALYRSILVRADGLPTADPETQLATLVESTVGLAVAPPKNDSQLAVRVIIGTEASATTDDKVSNALRAVFSEHAGHG